MSEERSRGRIISIDEGLVKSQLGSVVRETVERTLSNKGIYQLFLGKA